MSSSRRTTAEINILAMLDGQAPGRRLRALPEALWYGVAGLLACSLLAALAWLVRDGTPAPDGETTGTASASPHSGTGRRDTAGTASAGAIPVGPDGAHDAGASVAHHGGETAHDSIPPTVARARATPGTQAPSSAAVPESIAEPTPVPTPASTPVSTAASIPPIASSGAHAAANARGAVIIDLAQQAPATAAPPAQPTAVPATPANVATGLAAAAFQTAVSRHATTRAARPSSPLVMPRPAYRASPSRAPSLAHRDAAPVHQKRTAASRAMLPPAVVDIDVAVISAILQHTGSRHVAADAANAAGTAACAGKSCPRMPSRQ